MERKKMLNILLWFLAFLIINIIWANVASNEASQQLNDRGFEFQSEREVSLQAVFGSNAELPITITTEFVHIDDPDRIANASWKLIDASNNVVLNWAGTTNEVVTLKAELPPGAYSLNTTVDENVIAIQHLDVAPFAPLAILGHVVLSVLLVALLWRISSSFHCKAYRPSEVNESKPKEFRKSRIGMPEVDGHDADNDSPWRDPITL